MLKQTIDRALSTEMDRKDFLKLMGLGVVAATGFGQVAKVLSQHTGVRQSLPTSHQVQLGYGGSVYGGLKKHS